MQQTNTTRSARVCLFGGALFQAGLAAVLAAPAAADPVQFNDATVRTGLDGLTRVATGDIDGDGRRDIVSGSKDGLTWYENDGGSPPFFNEIQTVYAGDYQIQALAVADITGDGHAEILFNHSRNAALGAVRWFRNSGDPAQPFPQGQVFPSYMGPEGIAGLTAIVPADLDRDGDIDILGTGPSAGTVFWLENSGGANPFFSLRTVSGTSGNSIAVDDIDGDGHLDFVVGRSGNVVWFQSDGMSPPTFAERAMGATGGVETTVSTGDVDGDGDIDVFFGRFDFTLDENNTGWFENNGGTPPAFSAPQFFTTTNRDTDHIQSTDVDGDGDLDLIGVVRGPTDALRWWDNDGAVDPTFTERTIVETASGRLGSTLALSDLDDDGDDDAVIANGLPTSRAVVWHENTSDPLPVITSQPDGEFLTAPDPATFSVVANAATTYRWQLNGRDLPPDPLFSGQETPTLRVIANESTEGVYRCIVGNASGDVISDEVVLGVVPATSTCLGDLNGDGTTDVFDFADFATDFGCETD